MSEDRLLRIDGIKWWVIKSSSGIRVPQPICPKHDIRLKPKYSSGPRFESNVWALTCAECEGVYGLPRDLENEKAYILDKIDSKIFKNMKVINVDEEAIPLAKDEIAKSESNPYWVEAKLVESKSGKRLVVYAGERNKKNKTQIFVEPSNRRLSFDHNDHHPTDVFVKLEAIFDDGTRSSLEK